MWDTIDAEFGGVLMWNSNKQTQNNKTMKGKDRRRASYAPMNQPIDSIDQEPNPKEHNPIVYKVMDRI